MSHSRWWILFGLCAGNLLLGCLVGVMIPFFPGEAQQRGVSETVIGGVFSVYALTQFIFAPLASRLIPWLGATKVLHTGLVSAGISTIALGVVDLISDATVFITACFVVRFVEAVGTAAFLTATFAILANQYSEDINAMVGLTEMMTALGIALGPALGGGLYALGGYSLPFYALGIAILLCSLLNVIAMPVVGSDSRLNVNTLRMLRLYVTSYENWLNCGVLLMVSIGWTGLDPVIGPYLIQVLNITPDKIGLFYLVASGVYAVSGPVLGKVYDSVFNNYILMTVSLILAAFGMFLIPPAPFLGIEPRWFLVAIGLTFRELFAGSAYIPTFSNMLAQCLRVGMEDNIATQAFVSSVWWGLFFIGNTVGPTIAGALTDSYGFPVATTVLAMGVLLSAVPSLAQAVLLGARDRSKRSKYVLVSEEISSQLSCSTECAESGPLF